MNIRIPLSLGILIALVTAAPHAQDSPPAPIPTFRSEVRLLQFDAVVRDDDGNFVPHLSKDDFELLEDNKPQQILSVAEVNLPRDTRGRPAPTVTAGAVSAATGIESDAGRVYVMVIMGASERNRQIARMFIDEYLGPTDLMAVLYGSRAVTQGLSGDKAELRSAIDRSNAAPPLPDLVVSSDRNQEREPCSGANDRISTLRRLKDVVVNLSAVGGRRKAILYISAGSGVDFEDCTPVRREYDDMVRMAVRNDVRIYPIDPRGFQGGVSDMTGNLLGIEGSAGMVAPVSSPRALGAVMGARILANDTGGIAIANTGNFGGGFKRIVRDNSEYYVVSYYTSAPRDGAFHPVSVRVRNRPALEIRARSGYTAGSPDQKGKAVNLPKLLSASARDLLTAPGTRGELRLELFTSVYQVEGYQGSVLIGAHLPGATLHLAPNDRIELSYAAIDRWGKIRAVERRAFTLTLNETMRARVAQSGVRLFGRIQLPRGTYQIRVAASQPGGASGAATADVEVPDYTDLPLSISDVVVSSALGRTLVTLEEDPVLRQALPTQPSASRRFARTDTMTPFAEIYDTHWILTRELGLTSTVRDADGRVVARGEQILKSGNRGRFYFKGSVPLASFAPGKYVLNLEAYTRDGIPASTSKEMAFEVE